MRATDSLDQDHRIIEVVLPALERLGQQAAGSRLADREAVEMALAFLRTFVDAYHHGKEELHLFKAMERRGVHRDVGLVFHLLEEHGRGRKHVRSLLASSAGAIQGDPEAAKEFADNAAAYVKLLRHHIREENAELWPLASRVLSDDDDSRLMEGYAEVEHATLGDAGRELYRGRAADIARRVEA
jgi:hemerythrin-like domain-containing protein